MRMCFDEYATVGAVHVARLQPELVGEEHVAPQRIQRNVQRQSQGVRQQHRTFVPLIIEHVNASGTAFDHIDLGGEKGN